jgi:hypothetical protein
MFATQHRLDVIVEKRPSVASNQHAQVHYRNDARNPTEWALAPLNYFHVSPPVRTSTMHFNREWPLCISNEDFGPYRTDAH